VTEEDKQWTLVHHQKSNQSKSYCDAVHSGCLLTSANRVPMGNRHLSAATVCHSVFDGISLPCLDHRKDHSSVFEKSSHVDHRVQILKGKQPAYSAINDLDPAVVPICGKCIGPLPLTCLVKIRLIVFLVA
jgi:hypothetical protein